MGDIGAGVADTIGYDAGIGEAIDAPAGVGTGASAGVSTGTNFGCVDDAGMYTNDGSGGTALAGVADGAPAPDFGATSVTRRSSGTFDSAFFWLEQPPATTHNNPIAMNVRVVTKCLLRRNDDAAGPPRESGTTRVATVYRESPRAAVKK